MASSCAMSWPLLLLPIAFLLGVGTALDVDVSRQQTVSPYRPFYSEIGSRFGRPTPKQTMMVGDSTRTGSFEVVVAVGIDSDARDLSRVHIDGLRTILHDDTWQMLDTLDLSGLPSPCNSTQTFAPALAVCPSKQELVLFGFGPQAACHHMFVWRGHAIYEVQALGGESVPHFMHAVATAAVSNGSSGSFLLYSFGGVRCEKWPCPSPTRAENGLWVISVTFTGSVYGGKWRVVPPTARPPVRLPPSPIGRLLASLFSLTDNSLLLHGGFQKVANGFQVLPEVWLFNGTRRTWQLLGAVPMNATQALPIVIGKLEQFGSLHYESVYLAAKSVLLVVHNCTRQNVTELQSMTAVNEGVMACQLANASSFHCKPVFPTSQGLQVFLTRFSLTSNRKLAYMVHYQGEESLRVRNFNFEKEATSVGPIRKSPSLVCYVGNTDCLSSNPLTHWSHRHHGFQEEIMIGGRCLRRPVFQDPSAPITVWFLHRTTIGIFYRLKIVSGGPIGRRALGQSITKLQTKAVLFGGLQFTSGSGFQKSYMDSVWCFDLEDHYWMKRKTTAGSAVAPHRSDHVVIPHTNTSFLVYGGLSVSKRANVLGDIWLLNFSDLASCSAQWYNVSSSVSGAKLQRVYGHRLASVQGRHFVYGGSANVVSEDEQLSRWLYEIEVREDGLSVHVREIQLQPPVAPRMYHSLSQYTHNGLLLFGGELAAGNSLRTGDAFLVTVHPPAEQYATVKHFFRTTPIQGHYVAGDMVLSGRTKSIYKSCSATVGILVDNDHLCPAGQQRSRADVCLACPVNFISIDVRGSCQKCVEPLVTNGTGAVECVLSNPCSADTCNGHGKCEVTQGMKAVCKCDFGFLPRDNCRVAYVYISQVAVAVGLLLIAGVALHLRRYWRQRKELRRKEAELTANFLELKESKRKITQLNCGSNIQWSSLNLVSKLYEGQHNDVWLAGLDDMRVVVKTLPLTSRYCSSPYDAFCEEAETLRSMRHPNIVAFLGAGTERLCGRPFLVMEHVSRGSLYNVLHDANNSFGHDDRLRFGIDIAKGMSYLHGSSPPRIHRDLKSPNLLVTDKWTVKIADFGTARFLAGGNTTSDGDQKSKTGASSSSRRRNGSAQCLTTPLLSAEQATPPAAAVWAVAASASSSGSSTSLQRTISGVMTMGVGTLRWRSPELLLNVAYSERTDVYSFGVVLWEIFMRRLPYGHLKDEEEIRRTIIAGNCLPLPASMPYDYRHVIEDCLKGKPSERPSFPTILLSLEDQYLHGE